MAECNFYIVIQRGADSKIELCPGAINGSPAYIYFGESDGQVHKVNFNTGQIEATFQAQAGFGGSSADVADLQIDGDNNIIALGDFIYKLDPDLNQIWRRGSGLSSDQYDYISVNADNDVAGVQDEVTVDIWDKDGNSLGSVTFQGSFSGEQPTAKGLDLKNNNILLLYRATPPLKDPAAERIHARNYAGAGIYANYFSEDSEARALLRTDVVFVAGNSKLEKYSDTDGTLVLSGPGIYNETGAKHLSINDNGQKMLMATPGSVYLVTAADLTLDRTIAAGAGTTIFQASFDKGNHIYTSTGKVFDIQGNLLKDFSSVLTNPQCLVLSWM